MGLEQIKDNDGHFIVHTERKSGGIHHLETFLERLQIRNLRVAFGVRFFLRISVVNPVYFRRFENDFRTNLVGPQSAVDSAA